LSGLTKKGIKKSPLQKPEGKTGKKPSPSVVGKNMLTPEIPIEKRLKEGGDPARHRNGPVKKNK